MHSAYVSLESHVRGSLRQAYPESWRDADPPPLRPGAGEADSRIKELVRGIAHVAAAHHRCEALIAKYLVEVGPCSTGHFFTLTSSHCTPLGSFGSDEKPRSDRSE